MDMNDLWRRAEALLASQMNTYTYHAIIMDNLKPERLENGVLTLSVSIPPLKTAVLQHKALISSTLTQAAGEPIQVEIVTQGELEQQDTEEKPKSDQPDLGTVQLNPHYTFDTFIVGPSNRFAQAAAVAVSDNPAEVYNPLFLYGGVGLGKTHLMHAIGHQVHQRFPEKRMLYITSETFTNELISAIQQGRNLEFRTRFRNVDILMVDDIQFIAGRDATQDEFFHTFNSLYTSGKQIILTSDRPPQEIARLEERLRSRFAWGLIADIQRPDLETRIAILREKARRDGREIPDEVLMLIAENVQSNIRELEGSYNKLCAYAQLVGAPINEATCRDALREVIDKRQRRVLNADMIKRVVGEYFTVEVEELIGPSRRRDITVPRQIAIYLTREMTAMSLPQIGVAFGNRDHTTIMHAITQVENGMKNQSTGLAVQVNDIRHLLQEG